MTERDVRIGMTSQDPDLEKRVEMVESDLEIMERHAGSMAEAEDGIQSYMRKVDREHKDAHLHSVPKPRKHKL